VKGGTSIGQRFSIKSKTLGEDRPYWIYLPQSYDGGSQRYPVLYLLDGGVFFHSVSGVVQFMSSGIDQNMQIPEMIVVAIPNESQIKRMRDLTPTHIKGVNGEEHPLLETTGGGDAFLTFIRDELFPEIDSTYRTIPYRALVGHSLGGLLALHSLISSPDMFQSYIAIDPSVWWDDGVLLREAEDLFKDGGNLGGAVYISLANEHNLGLVDPDEPPPPTGREFAGALESVAGLRSKLEYFEAEDHVSVPLMSLYHGLLHIFDGYKPTADTLVLKPETLGAHFETVSKRLGVTLLPPRGVVNDLGYMLLHDREEPDKAIGLFLTNVSNYPEDWNAYDSLAEAYMVTGETTLAIENYETSLKLNPDNKNALERLEILKAQKERPPQGDDDGERNGHDNK
jgi:predicted alpha/beta superfamily hydrolase